MYNKVVGRGLYTLRHVPDHLKTQEVCDKAVHTEPRSLVYVPDHFNTQEMCSEAVHGDPYTLKYVPDNLKTHEMYNRAVEKFFDHLIWWD